MSPDVTEVGGFDRSDDGPVAVVRALRRQRWTIASAESLTAGLVSAGLADVPGCSDVLRGGIVAYQADVKQSVLRVGADAMSEGAVSGPVALEMASGARRLLGADVAVATTGVAGPEPHGGEPVGSVWIAVVTPGWAQARHLGLAGDRSRIRQDAVHACWELLLEALGNS